MIEKPDEYFMNRVKNGDLAAMAELFERYHVRIYNFMLKLTFDKSVSQDLTQNLFYRIIKYRHTYNSDHSFKSWIFRMARNIHIDYCRQQQKVSEQFKQVEEYDMNIGEETSAYDEEDYERLDMAFARLNPDQKEIIILSRFQKLKYEEISCIKDISVPSIKVQMHRAIKLLKEYYFKLT